jgi:hypothetical protein
MHLAHSSTQSEYRHALVGSANLLDPILPIQNTNSSCCRLLSVVPSRFFLNTAANMLKGNGNLWKLHVALNALYSILLKLSGPEERIIATIIMLLDHLTHTMNEQNISLTAKLRNRNCIKLIN